MMHPELSRELSRVQQRESLQRHARRESTLVSTETSGDRTPRQRRRRAALSPLRLVARLQPRGH